MHDTHKNIQQDRGRFIDGIMLLYGNTKLDLSEVYVNVVKKDLERKIAQLLELYA